MGCYIIGKFLFFFFWGFVILYFLKFIIFWVVDKNDNIIMFNFLGFGNRKFFINRNMGVFRFVCCFFNIEFGINGM